MTSETTKAALESFISELAIEGGPARTYREGDYRIVVNNEGVLVSCTRA